MTDVLLIRHAGDRCWRVRPDSTAGDGWWQGLWRGLFRLEPPAFAYTVEPELWQTRAERKGLSVLRMDGTARSATAPACGAPHVASKDDVPLEQRGFGI